MALLRRARPANRFFDRVFTRHQHQRQQEQQPERDNNEVKSGNGNKRPAIDEVTIRRLEKLALVGFEYEQSKRVLEEAVTFAERLRAVPIDEAVRPMCSTLENDCVHLRDDVARRDVDRREILRNAAVLEEEYFVAPLTAGRQAEGESK
ncbi:PREDICTED: glutamyl-tRNA(Gln) amidotransferase subunit C, mitochondrial-like [Vollenhovia emeryi]|uniref:glutamyl-tRNA(Gln) amidotransferase subunit C, mitochondrial-like n=1 Tax=Vollenhovia emeryi TaxID=411798 RepID=UPI0005F4A407|nr:PREDICTED: glutamyl-tRNA(Gln) amidotransferase subunit C, mitochondrial-like [Vollenhovia emeryi]